MIENRQKDPSCSKIGDRFTVLRTERKMARRFAKVSEEEIVAINEIKLSPLRVGEERWIYTSTLRVSV